MADFDLQLMDLYEEFQFETSACYTTNGVIVYIRQVHLVQHTRL